MQLPVSNVSYLCFVCVAQDVELIVHRALSLYRADGIGMADYALESSGRRTLGQRAAVSLYFNFLVVLTPL